MSMVSDRTELELFFSPSLGGNSPQFTTSPMFFELIVDLAKLREALAVVSTSATDVVSIAAREVLVKISLVESQVRAEQSRSYLQPLISLLLDVVRIARKGMAVNSAGSTDLLSRARKLLVSLLLVAKDSDDTALKAEVLSLAKHWETAR